jgi:hypothetical protein
VKFFSIGIFVLTSVVFVLGGCDLIQPPPDVPNVELPEPTPTPPSMSKQLIAEWIIMSDDNVSPMVEVKLFKYLDGSDDVADVAIMEYTTRKFLDALTLVLMLPDCFNFDGGSQGNEHRFSFVDSNTTREAISKSWVRVKQNCDVGGQLHYSVASETFGAVGDLTFDWPVSGVIPERTHIEVSNLCKFATLTLTQLIWFDTDDNPLQLDAFTPHEEVESDLNATYEIDNQSIRPSYVQMSGFIVRDTGDDPYVVNVRANDFSQQSCAHAKLTVRR